MSSIIQLLSREISARERIKNYLINDRPFAVSATDVDKLRYGELPIGHVISRDGFSPIRLIRGLDTDIIYVLGMPGQGKTNLLTLLCSCAMSLNDKNIIISRKGWEFSPLLRTRTDFYDLKPSDFRLNPFVKPIKELSQKGWNQRIAQTISSEGFMIYASGTNFEKILDTFTEKYPHSIITPSKLINLIEQKKSYRLIQVDEKVKNRLETLTVGEAKQVFDTNEVIDFGFYANSNLSFDLASFSGNQVSYFIAILLQMLVTWKLHNRTNYFHNIILDDFSDLVNDERDSGARMNEIAKLITVYGRKLKISLWIVAQSAFNTSKYVLDNSTTIIRFKTGAISDKVMEPVLKLNEKEQHIIEKCPRGFCVVLRKMVLNRPVLVAVPFFPLEELTDQEREELMKPRLKLLSRFVKEIPDENVKEPEQDNLSADMMHILKDYAINPYESMSEKGERMNYDLATLTRHVNLLREGKYLEPIDVSMGKGSGIVKLFKLTEKSTKIVGKQNLVGRGSIVHGFWMHKIKDYYMGKNFNAEIEWYAKSQNGLVDLAVFSSDGKKKIAVEIALSNKFGHEVENIGKCIQAGFEEVISCAPSQNILNGIKKEALNKLKNLNKVQFKLLREYYTG